MFAVVRTGGTQYRVAPGDKIVAFRLKVGRNGPQKLTARDTGKTRQHGSGGSRKLRRTFHVSAGRGDEGWLDQHVLSRIESLERGTTRAA